MEQFKQNADYKQELVKLYPIFTFFEPFTIQLIERTTNGKAISETRTYGKNF